METEVDPRIRGIRELLFEQEVSHLHAAAVLLEMYEGRDRNQVIPDGTFPGPLRLTENIACVRRELGFKVCETVLQDRRTENTDVGQVPGT